MKFYFDLSSEYTENIGIMELHVIPNVGSVNSEHYLRDCLARTKDPLINSRKISLTYDRC